MKIIGLDLGTSCGWGLLDNAGGRLGSGTWDLSLRRGEGEGFRYLRFGQLLEELLVMAGPGAWVAYEDVARHAGTHAAHVYGALRGEMLRVLTVREVSTYKGVPVGQVKKLATGRGNADKAAMMLAACGRWGNPMGTDDEADALWVAEAVRREVTGS